MYLVDCLIRIPSISSHFLLCLRFFLSPTISHTLSLRPLKVPLTVVCRVFTCNLASVEVGVSEGATVHELKTLAAEKAGLSRDAAHSLSLCEVMTIIIIIIIIIIVVFFFFHQSLPHLIPIVV